MYSMMHESLTDVYTLNVGLGTVQSHAIETRYI